VQGWTKEAAVQELTKGDFGFHTIWFNIPNWVENLNIDAMCERTHAVEVTEM
jgi:hypothetical protein